MVEWYVGREEYPHHDDLPCQHERILDREWDYLLVFDAARLDVIRHIVGEEYPDLTVEALRTPAVGSTPSWVSTIFCDDDTDWSDLHYISANPMTEWIETEDAVDSGYGESLDPHVMHHDKAWKYIRDTKESVTHPEDLTEYATKQGDPVLVHYIQPHEPYIGNVSFDVKRSDPDVCEWLDIPKSGGGTYASQKLAQDGHISTEFIRKCYEENARLVWREAKRLINNWPNKHIVVTADHGERLGPEKFDHGPPNTPFNRVVPWLDIPAGESL